MKSREVIQREIDKLIELKTLEMFQSKAEQDEITSIIHALRWVLKD